VIYRVVYPECVAQCNCPVPTVPFVPCTSASTCSSSLSCQEYNGASYCSTTQQGPCNVISTFSVNSTLLVQFTSNNSTIFCSQNNVITISQCLTNGPYFTDIVYVAIILIDFIVSTYEKYARSYIYPITIPETILFARLWECNTCESIKEMLDAIGKFSFGRKFDVPQDHPVFDKYKKQ